MQWYFYVFGSVVFAAAFAIARKKALEKEHALDFESARSFFVVLILLFFLPLVEISVSWAVLFLVYLSSLLAAVGIVFMSKAYRHSEISLIYPLNNLKPFFVFVLAYFFLSEKISLLNASGVFLLLISAYALEADHHFSDFFYPLKSLFSSKYNIYFIFSLVLFSITSLFDKYFVSNFFTPLSLLFIMWILISLNLNIIHGVTHGFKEVRDMIIRKPALPLLVAVFSVGSNFLYLTALQTAYVSLVTPLLMLSTLLVVVIGGKFFKEQNLFYRAAISVVMLVGAYLIII